MLEARIPPSLRPRCGRLNDAASSIGDPGTPKPGDLSVCIGCAALLEFGPDLRVLAVSDDKAAGLFAAQPGLQAVIRQLQATIRRLPPDRAAKSRPS